MAQDACFFIYENDIVILIDDVKRWGSDSEIRALTVWRLKKFIVYIHLYNIADGKFVIAFCTLAADFDAFKPYVFLREGIRERWDCLRHESIKPEASVIFPYDEFFQCFFPYVASMYPTVVSNVSYRRRTGVTLSHF